MSKRSSWFQHRTFIGLEVMLLVGAANQAFGDWVLHRPELANWAKTLFTMAGVLGSFGAIFAVLARLAKAGMTSTHAAVRALPLAVPMVIVHLGIFFLIFVLYAWLWGFWPLWK